MNHSWRPSSHLSVDTNGSLGFVDAESDLADTKGHNARFSSQTLWSDPERPQSEAVHRIRYQWEGVEDTEALFRQWCG